MDWASQQREQRRRTDDESTDCFDMTDSGDELPDSPNTKKMRDDQHCSPAFEFGGAVTEGTSSSMSLVCGSDGNSSPCLVKSDLKLNDVFEFIGVLTSNQEPQMEKDSEFTNGFCEDPSLQFLHNKVSFLHCFVYRKLAAQDFLKNNPMVEPKPHLIREIREALLRHLMAILSNDDTAAQFLLLHLLSKVHARVDTVAVGKLSLNLISFSKGTMSIYGNQLSIAVKDLLPFTHSIPLTVEYFNSTSLAPKKDYDTNRLTTAVLQLAEGSHVIVDETKLKAGILNSVGVENTRLLKILMQLQKVVENDLLAAMQADRSLSPDDFSRWLTMGRLRSLSFGETCLLLEHWEMIKELEKLRRERIKWSALFPRICIKL